MIANDVKHHVQRLGGGDRTVVFLHGLVMDNLSSWYFVAGARAAADSDVIVYDLRGHGRSDRPDSGYTLDDYVADLAALLDGLEVDRPVHLVGNSFGGQLAAAFAVAHPQRVASVALIDAHLGKPGWGDDMAATLSLEGEEADTAIATHFQSWLGRHSARKRNRLAETAKALVHGTTLVADMKRSAPIDDATLATLPMPVLALYGETSDIVDEADRIRRLVPQADVRILAGCSHSILWEATEDVVTAVIGWLASQ